MNAHSTEWNETNPVNHKNLLERGMEAKEDAIETQRVEVILNEDQSSKRKVHFTNASLSCWKHALEPRKLVQTNPRGDRFGKNKYESKLLTKKGRTTV